MEAVEQWQAPTTASPVHATVTVPGSKSLTNRALVLAALATPQGPSTISNALRSRDTDLMIGALTFPAAVPEDLFQRWGRKKISVLVLKNNLR